MVHFHNSNKYSHVKTKYLVNLKQTITHQKKRQRKVIVNGEVRRDGYGVLFFYTDTFWD